eukprot:1495740-Pleurochrysis_carterae.AAC.4
MPRWRLQQRAGIPCTLPVHERAEPKLKLLSHLSVIYLFEMRTEASHPYNKRQYKGMRTHDLMYRWLQLVGLQLSSASSRDRAAYLTKIETAALARYELEKDRLRLAATWASTLGSGCERPCLRHSSSGEAARHLSTPAAALKARAGAATDAGDGVAAEAEVTGAAEVRVRLAVLAGGAAKDQEAQRSAHAGERGSGRRSGRMHESWQSCATNLRRHGWRRKRRSPTRRAKGQLNVRELRVTPLVEEVKAVARQEAESARKERARRAALDDGERTERRKALLHAARKEAGAQKAAAAAANLSAAALEQHVLEQQQRLDEAAATEAELRQQLLERVQQAEDAAEAREAGSAAEAALARARERAADAKAAKQDDLGSSLHKLEARLEVARAQRGADSAAPTPKRSASCAIRCAASRLGAA